MRIDLTQLEFIDPRLREMALEVEAELGEELVITGLYRMDDPGVHGTLPLRGIDVRCKDKMVGAGLAAWVNARWSYDFRRPHMVCCMAHGEPFHLHLQVHPSTRRARS